MSRIGVFVCDCGLNIAKTVRVPEVVEFARTLPDVVLAEEYKFMCSTPGQELIQNSIKKNNLNRVIVAACSPLMHEKTFRKVIEAAGLNQYLLTIVNIREHVSWVTEDEDIATEKAKAMINGAVYRARLLAPLTSRFIDVNPNVMVVGGGIAGIQASLELAETGKKVYLVERTPSIGGHMSQFDKTFPTLDCAACILTPRMSEVGQHENVTLLSYAEVDSVSGSIGDFTVKIRKKARYVKEEACTGCGVCIEKCPQSVVDEVYEAGLGYRKAIYRPFPQAVPKYPVIDTAACTYFKSGKCKACQIFCTPGAIDFEQKDEVLEVHVGNIVLATGY